MIHQNVLDPTVQCLNAKEFIAFDAYIRQKKLKVHGLSKPEESKRKDKKGKTKLMKYKIIVNREKKKGKNLLFGKSNIYSIFVYYYVYNLLPY